MKLKNPILEQRRRKAEEKRRKKAAAKKKQQRLVLSSVGLLAAILLTCGMGALSEGSGDTDPSPRAESLVSSPAVELTSEPEETQPAETVPPATVPSIDLSSIPAFSGDPYVVLNDNVPEFTDADLSTDSFETYSDLDALGRCGVAYASIGTDLMPTEERGPIGQVKPSGWHTVKYDVVDGKYLYNRCHLIGYQLSAENANINNLITGTRYLNVEGMLPFENMVADYIKETGNHVLYRVTPIFDGDNLVASGVHMEAESVEDRGDGILFNVYCYNAQPGVRIDYASGDSEPDGSAGIGTQQEPEAFTSSGETARPEETVTPEETAPPASSGTDYILNTNTHKFHYPSCSSVKRMSEKNKQEFTGTRDEAISMGYDPCGNCNP